MPDENMNYGSNFLKNKTTRLVSGLELHSMPEFQAICKAIGFNYDTPTKEFTLHVKEDEIVITQVYQGHRPPVEGTDTTTLRNEQHRTKVPTSNLDVNEWGEPVPAVAGKE